MVFVLLGSSDIFKIPFKWINNNFLKVARKFCDQVCFVKIDPPYCTFCVYYLFLMCDLWALNKIRCSSKNLL